MTISTTPPVSLNAIRGSFDKSGRIASDDRYVRDFNQFEDDERWDLLAYRGQAYGLQYKIFNDGWAGGTFAGDLPLDETDKRADGQYAGLDIVPGGTYGIIGEDSEGKYAEMGISQNRSQDTPGAVAMNGRFYADDAYATYRIRAKVETGQEFSRFAEVGVFVFGYRYGYLDGSRAIYLLWGQGDKPGANKTLTVDETFEVHPSYRHVVVNPNCFMPGRYDFDKASFKVRDLTIEKV